MYAGSGEEKEERGVYCVRGAVRSHSLAGRRPKGARLPPTGLDCINAASGATNLLHMYVPTDREWIMENAGTSNHITMYAE